MIRAANSQRPIVPINADVNATPSAITNIITQQQPGADPLDYLLVHSVFYTIQGEGPFSGIPAVFVRLAGCNLGSKSASGCEGCDTAFHLNDGKAIQHDALTQQVWDAVPEEHRTDFFSSIGLVVITGGEPGLQMKSLLRWASKSRGFLEVNSTIEEPSPTIQLETNGFGLHLANMSNFDEELEALALDPTSFCVVFSPKATRLGYGEGHVGAVCGALDTSMEEYGWPSSLHIKVVVDHDPDSLHHDIPLWLREQLYSESVSSMWVSPMTVYHTTPPPGTPPSIWDDTYIDRSATSRNYAHAAALALRYNLRLSVQLHTQIGLL